MSELRELQHKEAVRRMQTLDMLAQAVQEFEEKGKVYRSQYGGLLHSLTKDEQTLVDEFEAECGGLVYHVIKAMTDHGMMYALLYVSGQPEEWAADMDDLLENKTVAYVVYMELPPDYRKCGSIGIKPVCGGVKRTW